MLLKELLVGVPLTSPPAVDILALEVSGVAYDSRKVAKAIMAPSVRGTKAEVKSGPAEMRKMTQFMTGLRKYVTENAEYVGPRFAEEARKIHYGETDDRHIYGEATLKEAKELVDEGVDVAPLPPDLNEAN